MTLVSRGDDRPQRQPRLETAGDANAIGVSENTPTDPHRRDHEPFSSFLLTSGPLCRCGSAAVSHGPCGCVGADAGTFFFECDDCGSVWHELA
jgi:hypothetical protein